LEVGQKPLDIHRKEDEVCMRYKKRQAESSESPPKTSGVVDPEAREAQLISLAMDLVEQRLRDGTATSQETVHFLKLGSSRERYEREKLEKENILLKAKTEALESQARIEDLYAKAIDAMKRYGGETDDEYRPDRY
jgi:hypothetical protein